MLLSGSRSLNCACVLVLLSAGVYSVLAASGGTHVPTPSTWRLDPNQSEIGGGYPLPKSDEITILKDEPGLFAWEEKQVLADGTSLNVSWSGKPDGEMRPIQGSGGDKISFSPDLTKGHIVQHDGSVGDYTQEFSADGKTLTELADVTLKSGQKVHMKMVYVRIR